jgi:hypothetical protein
VLPTRRYCRHYDSGTFGSALTGITSTYINDELYQIKINKVTSEVTGGWGKLHNEILRDLYSSPSIIIMIKSMRMRWARHIARMW